MNDRRIRVIHESKILHTRYQTLNIIDNNNQSLLANYIQFYEDLNCAEMRILSVDSEEKTFSNFKSLFKFIIAAGGIIRNTEGKLLFIKRWGIWDLPKGKLHKNETVSAAALREVTEETGVKNLSISASLPSTYHIYTDAKGREILKETKWFEMQCNGEQDFTPQIEEDITEVKWFDMSQIEDVLDNTYASIHDLLQKYLNTHPTL